MVAPLRCRMSQAVATNSLLESLISLPDEERRRIIASLSEAEAVDVFHDWRGLWARPNQLAPDGNWAIWLILTGRGWGKMLAVETPIPTPTGWTQLGDLQIGGQVFDEVGQVQQVSAIFDGWPDSAYRLRFSDGATIDACGDHPSPRAWFTCQRRNPNDRVMGGQGAAEGRLVWCFT